MPLFEIKKKTEPKNSVILKEKDVQASELIKRRRLQLLVHSCLYYGMNTNIITDEQFDKWSVELVKLQQEHPEESKATVHYDAFKEWDGSTGAFLPYRNGKIPALAQHLIDYGRKNNEH